MPKLTAAAGHVALNLAAIAAAATLAGLGDLNSTAAVAVIVAAAGIGGVGVTATATGSGPSPVVQAPVAARPAAVPSVAPATA